MTHVLAVTAAGALLWCAYFTHPEARLVIVLGLLLGVAIVLSPILIIRPVNEREHRELQAWGKDHLERQQVESDEEAA